MDTNTLEIALKLIAAERDRQDKKWGADRDQHDMIWLTILGEEFGESAEAILKHQDSELLNEVVQCAAVSVAWIENLLRGHSSEIKEDNGKY